jgi:hypothetical protein
MTDAFDFRSDSNSEMEESESDENDSDENDSDENDSDENDSDASSDSSDSDSRSGAPTKKQKKHEEQKKAASRKKDNKRDILGENVKKAAKRKKKTVAKCDSGLIHTSNNICGTCHKKNNKGKQCSGDQCRDCGPNSLITPQEVRRKCPLSKGGDYYSFNQRHKGVLKAEKAANKAEAASANAMAAARKDEQRKNRRVLQPAGAGAGAGGSAGRRPGKGMKGGGGGAKTPSANTPLAIFVLNTIFPGYDWGFGGLINIVREIQVRTVPFHATNLKLIYLIKSHVHVQSHMHLSHGMHAVPEENGEHVEEARK